MMKNRGSYVGFVFHYFKRIKRVVKSEGITEYKNQHGELVITARGVGVQTEKPVGS